MTWSQKEKWKSNSQWDNSPQQNPALPLLDSAMQEHLATSRAQVAATTGFCTVYEKAQPSLWQDVGFPTSQPLQGPEVTQLSLCHSNQHGRPTPNLVLLEARSYLCHQRVLARARSFSQAVPQNTARTYFSGYLFRISQWILRILDRRWGSGGGGENI